MIIAVGAIIYLYIINQLHFNFEHTTFYKYKNQGYPMHPMSRKIPLLFVLASVLSLVAGSGCNKDNGVEPVKNESLEGSWRLTSVILKDTPVGDMTLPAATFLEMSGTGATTSTMQFNEDGSASLTTTYEEGDDDVVPGTWSKDSLTRRSPTWTSSAIRSSSAKSSK